MIGLKHCEGRPGLFGELKVSACTRRWYFPGVFISVTRESNNYDVSTSDDRLCNPGRDGILLAFNGGAAVYRAGELSDGVDKPDNDRYYGRRKCRCSSMVEHSFRKAEVEGSTPSIGCIRYLSCFEKCLFPQRVERSH